MLAYILWHWPFDDVSSLAYEATLAKFHQSLLASAVPGFQESIVFRATGTTWAPPGARVYEDWYLLEGSGAMDPLNEAAVSQVSKLSHDNTALAAAGAAGGLYQLKLGRPKLDTCRFVSWITKPRGTGYEEFYRMVEPWTARPDASLWRRQMVLGPTPEFALVSPAPLLAEPTGEDTGNLGNSEVVPVNLELVWKKPRE